MTRTPAPPHPSRPHAGPLATYRALPRLAGRSFLPIALLARLPFSMTALGIMLLVTTSTGSVATGGLATGASSLGTALFGAVHGNLADRFGQRPVVSIAVTANAAAMVAVVLAAHRGAPLAVTLVACFATGATSPQVGAFARVRWIALTRDDPATLAASMGYESTVDELTFVLGPALVGLISAAASPELTLLAAALLTAVFGLAFAAHPTARITRPADGDRTAHRAVAARWPVRRLLPLAGAPLLGMAAMGVFFGGSQAAVTAFATDAGNPGLAGLLYAAMGVGSAATALAVVALPDRIDPRRRWVVAATGMTIVSSATLVVTGVGPIVAVLGVTGLFIGPAMVTIFTVGGNVSPVGRAGTVMTLLVSANVVGGAIGAAGAGAVAEAAGVQAAFGVPVTAAAALAVVGLLARGSVGRSGRRETAAVGAEPLT
ncbi:MFS transporter [Pengzhenrongella frigida]|uniref:MFS transporter n=1 Tax=Pengzhenrongella frigida TaxID=1259133 RepID=A0A4Q5MXC4_9MICO|nr:MFS transporter [Cellulomonas sp. HLT2-17]RYV50279.1 MFS transporter [Cellulomonas sp. HLT2-17]